MTFLVWRQYRLQWAIALALLAAFAAVELVDGLQVAHAWHSLLTTCTGAQAAPDGSCLQRTIVSTIGNDLRLLSEIAPGSSGSSGARRWWPTNWRPARRPSPGPRASREPGGCG